MSPCERKGKQKRLFISFHCLLNRKDLEEEKKREREGAGRNGDLKLQRLIFFKWPLDGAASKNRTVLLNSRQPTLV